jgi:phage tail-like protein
MADQILDVSAYNLLIQPIRDEDQRRGNQFVERLLQGRQAIWEATQLQIFALKTLMNVELCPDEYLQYLKWTVGWTSELLTDQVTRNLDYATLRRLIAASIPFWKRRGSEDALVDVLRLATGERARIWNYFDFRWVTDETELGEDHQGRDPWIIDLPGPPDYEELRFNVRIADPDGSLDRDLAVALCKLGRPCGERIELSYILALDLFKVDGDNVQWDAVTGAIPVVNGGTLQFQTAGSNEIAQMNSPGGDDWESYSTYARVRITASTPTHYGIAAYVQDADNLIMAGVYSMAVSTYAFVTKYVAGVPTVIAQYEFGAPGNLLPFTDGEWVGLRLEILTVGTSVTYRLYLDGVQLIDVTEGSPPFLKGRTGLYHIAGGTIEASEFEVIPVPMTTETIGINS